MRKRKILNNLVYVSPMQKEPLRKLHIKELTIKK